VDLPIENGDFPCFLYVYQRVNPIANHIYHIYPIYLSIYLSVCLSIYLSIYLYIYQDIQYLCVYIYIYHTHFIPVPSPPHCSHVVPPPNLRSAAVQGGWSWDGTNDAPPTAWGRKRWNSNYQVIPWFHGFIWDIMVIYRGFIWDLYGI